MASMNIMPLMTDALEADTASLSDERYGQYMRVLVRWWRDGCRPATWEHLSEISGVAVPDLKKMQRFLTETPEGLVQRKLFDVWNEQLKRSKKGKINAQRRWGNAKSDASGDATAMQNGMLEGCYADAKKMLSVNHIDIDAKEASISTPPTARKSEAEKIRKALEAVLTPDTAAAVVAHRQKLRKPLSVRAAELLAGKFAKCPGGADAAANTMIVNGWQGFEPEWLERHQALGPRLSPGSTKTHDAEVERAIAEGFAAMQQRKAASIA